jgi:nitrite reductase/ring-hydroxylating ferredoxin subunit
MKNLEIDGSGNSHPRSRISAAAGSELTQLGKNEFRTIEVPPGTARLVGDVAVFNVAGRLCATQARCTHRQAPLSKGTLAGATVTCPLHGAQFDVCTGAVLRGPARQPLLTYVVIVEGEVARIDVPVAPAAQSD